jgi:hypothetical protein
MTPRQPSHAEELYRIRETSIHMLQLERDLRYPDASREWDSRHPEHLKAYNAAMKLQLREARRCRLTLHIDGLLEALYGLSFEDLGLEAPPGVVDAHAQYGEWASPLVIDPLAPREGGQVLLRAHAEVGLPGLGGWDGTTDSVASSPYVSVLDAEAGGVELTPRALDVAFRFAVAGSPLTAHLKSVTLVWACRDALAPEDWVEPFILGDDEDDSYWYERTAPEGGYRQHWHRDYLSRFPAWGRSR